MRMESSALTLISEIGPQRHLVLNEEGRVQYVVENGDELIFFDDLKPIIAKNTLSEEKVEYKLTNDLKFNLNQIPSEAPKNIAKHSLLKAQDRQLRIYLEKLDVEKIITNYNLNNGSKIYVKNNMKLDPAKTSSKRAFKCNKCSKKYYSITCLRKHEFHNHSTETLYYTCDVCDKRYLQKHNLIIHIRNHNGVKPYKCNMCDKRFSRKDNMNVHEKRIHPSNKNNSCLNKSIILCQNDYIGNEHTKTQEKNQERPYKCKICDKLFTTSTKLRLHLRTHTCDKPYKCSVCDKGYTSIAHMRRHEQLHMNKKPYKCEECDKKFTTSTHLKIHTRIHTGDKPYKCNICDKGYVTSTVLKVHLRTHTGDKPYKCNMCDRSFGQKLELLIHVRRRHTGERPYKCNLCDKYFISSAAMRRHEKRHS